MNTTLRRLASVVMVMFLALMVSTTWIQFFHADELNSDTRNIRSIYAEYGRARGPIVVGGEAVALSKPVDDEFGYQREYTNGKLYSPLTGFFSLANGTTAIEHAENDYLNGQADALWVDRLQNLLTGRDPEGSSVELTVDPKAQKAAWDGLGDQRGAVVALDPKTGAILALVSKPSYDPNDLASHSTKEAGEAYTNLLNADGNPLKSNATADAYPPGSTFKLVTTAAALESGDYTPDTVIDAPSAYTLTGTSTQVGNFAGTSCASAGKMTLADALRISCNTAFLGLAGDLGADAMDEQAEKFGYGDKFQIPFSTAASVYDQDPDSMNTAQVELSGIGQGSVIATPLQVAMVSAAIANGGEVMEPYSVDTVRDPQLEVVRQTSPTSLGRAVSEKTAGQLTEMMKSVVESGSGTSAQISGVEVAGKTGTAQHGADTSKTDPHVWFTGFAPADDPQVAVAVVVEDGGDLGGQATGGSVSAPIAKAVMEAVLNG